MLAKSEDPDPDLGLQCLPMSQKWDARLIWVKTLLCTRNDPKFSDTQNICCNHSKV